MSKFGWDLPPGCRTSDIPGNRPQDLADEAMYESIDKALSPVWKEHEEENFVKAAENVAKLLNDAFEQGYRQCESDAAEARFWKKNNKQRKKKW